MSCVLTFKSFAATIPMPLPTNFAGAILKVEVRS
jgi:hypothetical protein